MNPCKVEMTKYNILRKGKVIFWDVSQSELFDRLEDYAVESYVTGSPKPSEMMGSTYVTETRPKKTRQGTGKHSKYSATSRNSARKRYRGQGR